MHIYKYIYVDVFATESWPQAEVLYKAALKAAQDTQDTLRNLELVVHPLYKGLGCYSNVHRKLYQVSCLVTALFFFFFLSFPQGILLMR